MNSPRLNARYLWLSWLLWLTTRTIASNGPPATATTGPGPVEVFKRFTSAPPVVDRLVYRYKLPAGSARQRRISLAPGSTMDFAYVTARWQPSAFLYRKAFTPDGLEPGLLLGEVAGISCGRCWRINRGDGTLFTCRNTSLTNDPLDFVARKVEELYYDVAQVMNMGVKALTIGSIKWDGDSFSVASERWGLRVSGTLTASANAQVEKLTVLYTSGRHSTRHVIRYDYAGSKDSYLPTRIDDFLSHEGGEIQLDEVTILKLDCSPEPQPEARFSPKPYLGRTGFVSYLYQQGSIYREVGKGRLQLVSRVTPSKWKGYVENYSGLLEHGFWIAAFATVVGGVLVVLSRLRAGRRERSRSSPGSVSHR